MLLLGFYRTEHISVQTGKIGPDSQICWTGLKPDLDICLGQHTVTGPIKGSADAQQENALC